MFSLEILSRINAEVQAPTPPYALRLHTRIVGLTRIVNQLPVDKEYRRWLRHSLWKYADQIITRTEPPSVYFQCGVMIELAINTPYSIRSSNGGSYMSESVESLIAYCRENARVCPMPQRWNMLWELLPDRVRAGGGWEPALPLILAAWHDTPGMLKMLRLAEHIEWAAKHGALESVAFFLRDLREEDWFHIGD